MAKNKKFSIKKNLFYILCVFAFFLIWYQSLKENRPLQCQKVLKNLENLEFDVLLIDFKVLKKIDNGQCFFFPGDTLKLATNLKNRLKWLEMTENISKNPIEMVFFKNLTQNDYLEFSTEPRAIIPKNFNIRKLGNVLIPNDIPIFLEFWKRSRFLECLGIDMKRNLSSSAHQKALDWSGVLAELRDELLAYRTFSFLSSGTLLGWYRECSIIPHTRDMDVAVLAVDFEQKFVDDMLTNSSRFKLSRKLGMVNDSFELTVAPRGRSIYIDIFYMYKENDSHWVGGVSQGGQKYKFIYAPSYDPYCAADIHGHIFWVTCTPEIRIPKEYGNDWKSEILTKNYDWSRPAVKNGKWTGEQMKDVYVKYK